jgi:ABC-type dipeptide/oligopeptide/nickel transport system ATPase component
MERILEVKDLKIQFDTEEGTVYALENVSFHLNKGEILGIIGETGSGKSVTASAINRILPVPPARIVNGEIIFQGKDVLQYKREEMNRIRGKKISMIFQEPMTALNPVFKIKEQMSDVIMHHQKINRKKAVKQATEMLEQVRIPDPEMVLDKYPHELSGGMRQRVMIATALSCEADLLIADEPTTALDVTTQDQILALIQDMRKKLDISVILITHDFGVVAEICDTVAVMYGGSVVEFTDIYTLTKKPYHPPRECSAILGFKKANIEKAKELIESLEKKITAEFKKTDPDFKILFDELNELPKGKTLPLKKSAKNKIIHLLLNIPNGINSMSQDIEGLVESSNNLGVITFEGDKILFENSTRSSVESKKIEINRKLEELANYTGCDFENDSDYPGWKYREDSRLREHMKKVYQDLFGKEPIVKAIHAGLECGLFLDVIGDDLDMIAIGPNMHDVHTPDEHLELDSAGRVYSFLIETLKRMKEM